MSKKMDMLLKRDNGVFIPDSIRKEAIKAKMFLVDHPAIKKDNDVIYWSIQEVCKRGITELGPIAVWNTSANRKKFPKEFSKYPKKDKYLCIYKPYKEVYGEEWKFDHVEFWWETSISIFMGSVEANNNEWADYTKWEHYAHGEGGALTIEQCLIDAAKFTKETLGDFGFYSFITKAEEENNRKHPPFVLDNNGTKKEIINPFTGKVVKTVSMINNDKHISINSGMRNRRWLKWFMNTPYYKKHWGGEKELKELVKIQPFIKI